ncbi:phosphoribosylaminoimidazolesuccinocarboxamide synthase [Patescibacteria group bacterium]
MNRKPYLSCLPLRHQGKVRDSFNGTTTPGTFLIVATNAISTHNVAHKSLVPDKGQLLNALSIFWKLEALKDVRTHIVAFGWDIYKHLPKGRSYPDDLHLRAVVVKVLDMVPVEFIYRDRLAGSLYDKFYTKGLPNPYGIELEQGLQLMHKFDTPIFTPTDKSETDEPLNSSDVALKYSEATSITRNVYELGFDYAKARGIDIIDTKEEGGYAEDGEFYLGDEWLNGDSSRFVASDAIIVGKMPPWQDKEIARQWAIKHWAGGKKVPLEFPDVVLQQTSAAYHGIFEQLTGGTLEQFWKQL